MTADREALERVAQATPSHGGRLHFSFAVRSDAGAVEFQFYVGGRDPFGEGPILMPDVEIHSSRPFGYSCDAPDHTDCRLTGGNCWHGGTSLWASEHVAPGFMRHGLDWLWALLEERHARQFRAATVTP